MGYLRCYPPTPPPEEDLLTALVWDAQAGATSYVLQVGSGPGLSDVYNANVGNVRTHSLDLAAGTYYWRVVPQGAGATTAEETVTIS